MTLISRCPKSGRRISSRTLAASVSTLPFQSIHVSSRTPIVSITRVSPDHFADEYPCHEGPDLRARPRVREYLAVSGVHFVQHHQEIGLVDELQHVR